MLWCNLGLHLAIGTSAAIGFPIAISGALGYVAKGLSAQGLPVNKLKRVFAILLLVVATKMLLSLLA